MSLRSAVFVGICVAYSAQSAAEPPQLIVAPHGGGTELRIVAIGSIESRLLAAGVDRPLFPSWRDSGRQLAFSSDSTGHSQIFALNFSDSTARNLTSTSTNEYQPAYSPDGAKLLFTSDRGGNHDIYVMDSDGQHPVNLTNSPGFDSDAAWSPDGKRIAFASDRSGKGFHLMVMNADGSQPRNLVDRDLGGMLYPCWSPDGQQIAFSGLVGTDRLELYIANSDGTAMQSLTEGSGMNCYPAWSPDGRYLSYVHFDKHPSQCPDGGRLMLLDTEAGTTSEFAGAPRVTASRMAWRPSEE
jgi:TolB protein